MVTPENSERPCTIERAYSSPSSAIPGNLLRTTSALPNIHWTGESYVSFWIATRITLLKLVWSCPATHRPRPSYTESWALVARHVNVHRLDVGVAGQAGLAKLAADTLLIDDA